MFEITILHRNRSANLKLKVAQIKSEKNAIRKTVYEKICKSVDLLAYYDVDETLSERPRDDSLALLPFKEPSVGQKTKQQHWLDR